MNLYFTNPLTDPRWDDLVSRHDRASAFHQHGWLEALSRTYGYKPLVLTTAPAGKPMRDGIVFCRVSSWVTGTRIVSLPFADHCEPLIDDQAELTEFLNQLQAERRSQRWRYIEIRPLSQISNGQAELQPSRSYCYHELDLAPSLEQIFQGLHKDSIRRRIQHAEREGLVHETGRSESFVDQFYRLLLRTRRRHQLLPQPRAWFKNLVECMDDNIQIRLARKDGTPIAAMMTLRHRSSVIYKYGCSDERLHNLGAMPFLFWKLIEESKALGAQKIDFGRSDWDQESLINFKDKFGSTRKVLNYYRYPVEATSKSAAWSELKIRQFFSLLPDSISSMAGRLVYRHIG
jgi:CelD/BcsL family acetyltransferase involved in cellulose biosynthesis